MASASCAGPLPPYPHSKPVGLWLRSVRRGLRGLRWLFPPITQTTHPSGPRQPAYTFLLHGRCSAVLVSAFIVLPFMGSKTPPAGRFATTGQGRRASEPRLSGWLALGGGAAGALARRTLAAVGAQAAALHFTSRPGTAMYWALPAWRCCRRPFASVFGSKAVALSRDHGHSEGLFGNLLTWARRAGHLVRELTNCHPRYRSLRQSGLCSGFPISRILTTRSGRRWGSQLL